MAALQIPGPAHDLPNSTLGAGSLRISRPWLFATKAAIARSEKGTVTLEVAADAAVAAAVAVAFAVEFVFFLLLLRIPKQSLCLTVNDDCTLLRLLLHIAI